MLQLLQHLGDGRTLLVEAPAPGPTAGSLLIRTSCSLVSAGTERMLVNFGRAGWLGKIRQQPEKVRAVLDKMRAEGPIATFTAVRAKLAQPIPLGYCHVGCVVDSGGVEGIAAGDRVVSNGPHAEVVSMPSTMCARIPDGVPDDAAAFTPLAAIALEGINLLAVREGDQIVVTGLGLIGQLAVRILVALRCQVLGVDPVAERRVLAERAGARALAPGSDTVAGILAWSGGKGVAGNLITASTSSEAIVNEAARSCRRRGKVVLVGVVGLRLNRADFYRNEVSFQVSCSYGQRDGNPEDSAQVNFRRVLHWMEEGKLPVTDLITKRSDFREAAAAYEALAEPGTLGMLLDYSRSGEQQASLARSMVLRPQDHTPGAVAVIGAGNFAFRTLLPALARVPAPPRLAAVVSSQGAPAFLAAQTFEAGIASTDFKSVLAAPEIDAVLLTTRHDAHVRQALQVLRHDKNVWVEKPLALDHRGVTAVMDAARTSGRIVMVGFNRRFAPIAVKLREAVASRTGPLQLVATINAGRLPGDHWTLDPIQGGGRIVGEACHWMDLLRFFVGAKIESATCLRRDRDGQDGGCFEFKFADGSLGRVDYRTDLPRHESKERIEIAGPGYTARIDNWARLSSNGLNGLSAGGWLDRTPRKGHVEALAAFLAGCAKRVAPIPVAELAEVSRWAINAQSLREGETILASQTDPESTESKHTA